MPQHPPPVVHAGASVTISWNVQGKSASAPSRATVTSVRGTTVTVRMNDGTTRRYVASAQEAAVLRTLVGQTIAFRVDSDR